MKLFNAFAVSTFGAVIIFSQPSVAQVGTPNWTKGGCDDAGSGCFYYRVINRNYPFVTAKEKSTFKKEYSKYYHVKDTEVEFNCDNWQYRNKRYEAMWDDELKRTGPYKWARWSEWNDVLPGTVGETNLRAVCG